MKAFRQEDMHFNNVYIIIHCLKMVIGTSVLEQGDAGLYMLRMLCYLLELS